MNNFKKLENLPEANLKLYIANMKVMSRNNASIDVLKNKFKELLSYTVCIVMGYAYHYYYRAQKTTENNIARLINPPTTCVTEFGRCNDKYESIFYCSNCYVTSILETKPNIGEIVTVLISELTDINNETHITPIISLAREKMKDIIPYSFTLSDNEKLNCKLKMITDFFSEVMLQVVRNGEEWKYNISIALSKAFFEEYQNTRTGLAFPSLASRKYGFNFALPPIWFQKISNPKFRAFRLEITAKSKDFNSVGLITHVAQEMDADGFFLFKDVSQLKKNIKLNSTFYDEYEQIFETQKQTLKKDSFFYRRYAPDCFIL